MAMKTKQPGRALSIPAGLGLSLIVNIGITTIIAGLISMSIHRGIMNWETVGYLIMSMLLLSSFIGAKTAIYSIKTQNFLISAMAGILYWMYLLCITALFFGGNYQSVFETAALIAAGSITAALLRIPKKRRYYRK